MESTLGSIFRRHFADYAQRHNQPLYVYRAAYWLANCRTQAIGGHLNRCPEGHVEHASYNSCHQRYCPQCQGLATERWLQTQKARLLNCAHHHLIFTIPHEFNELWIFNRAPMAKLLFAAVRDTLTELLADPKYLGARPAFLLALHTWGRSLILHPHIHALVADGGLTDAGTWVQPRRSHFLPARVVMLLFRGKFIAALRGALEDGTLRLPPNAPLPRLTSLLNKTARVKWNVRLCTRYANGAGVTAYLARYVRGGALKNSQIVASTREHISFRYRPHRDEDDTDSSPQLMRLTPDAFLSRYLAHVPPPALQSLRAYGLYAHTQRQRLDQAREHLGQPAVETPEPITPQAFLATFANARSSTHCPRCGHALITVPLQSHATGPPKPLH